MWRRHIKKEDIQMDNIHEETVNNMGKIKLLAQWYTTAYQVEWLQLIRLIIPSVDKV